MNLYDVAIIGGGFSGLCLASMLDRKKVGKVVVFEGNKRVGKKILVTGNGQGNVTNMQMSAAFYHGDREFAANALARFDNIALINFFSSLGLLTCERDGKVYPASFVAGALSDVLRFRLADNGIEVLTERLITDVASKGDRFLITDSSGGVFNALNVVFAFGGSSGDGFLTDGKSFALARKLGHTVGELSPSLVQIKTERDIIKGLKGIKQEAYATIYDGDKPIKTVLGDVLFTDFGISGNCAFALSAYLKGLKKPNVGISFLPQYDEKKLYDALCKKAEKPTDYGRLLVSVLPLRLALAVLKRCGFNESAVADEKGILKIVGAIKRFSLKTEGTAGFKSSQVTAGGINTREVDVSTMESKLVGGLYIIGEALDVDGDCGGYNLQWAYTSAAVCADALNKKRTGKDKKQN